VVSWKGDYYMRYCITALASAERWRSRRRPFVRAVGEIAEDRGAAIDDEIARQVERKRANAACECRRSRITRQNDVRDLLGADAGAADFDHILARSGVEEIVTETARGGGIGDVLSERGVGVNLREGRAGLPALLAWSFRRFAASRFIRKNPHVLGPIQHTINRDGIHSSSANGNSSWKWSAIVKATESPQIFLLFPQSNYAIIIPKPCFDNPDKVTVYREMLRKFCSDTKGLLA